MGPPVIIQTEDESIKLANNSRYGLGAGIWTSDLSRAHRVSREIDAGLVWINTHHRNDPSSPWSVHAYRQFLLGLLTRALLTSIGVE